MAALAPPSRSAPKEKEPPSATTFAALLSTKAATPLFLQKRPKAQSVLSTLILTKEQRQQQGERMRGMVASTPVGTHGSEWMRKVSSTANLASASSAEGNLSRAASASTSSSLMPNADFSPKRGARTLPNVTSMPNLVQQSLQRHQQTRRSPRPLARSASSLLEHEARSRRFVPHGKRLDSDALTPRTVLAAEERLLAYLAAKDLENGAVNVAKLAPTSRKEGAIDPSMLSNAALRDYWDLDATPLSIAPAPTAVAQEMLEPLSDSEAIEVLRTVRICAELSNDELAQLLRVGTRKLLPKYAVPMREGAIGSSFFIVLRGQLEVLPSRLEIQAYHRAMEEVAPSAKAAAGSRSGGRRSGLSTIAGPAMTFGELSLLQPVPRERTAITLEGTELLSLSAADLQRLSPQVMQALHSALRNSFTASALRSVPFFNTLPDLTQRQIAQLLGIESFGTKELICRQGDTGDKMYIVLWGSCEVWRSKRRGWEPEKIAAYSGFSTLPWFGEVFQWVDGHGRAGDVVCTEETLTLSLHRDDLQDFIFFAPGFKALSMSAASAFTVKSTRAGKAGDAQKTLWEGNGGEKPLRFAVQWARMIGKIVGLDMESAALVKVQQVRRKKVNSMDWVKELIEEETVVRLFQTELDDELDTPREAFDIFESERRKLMAIALRTEQGDSRSLASIASSKGWRAGSPHVHWNVRTEMLREAALRGELKEQRQAIKQQPLLPDSFPVKVKAPPPRRSIYDDSPFEEEGADSSPEPQPAADSNGARKLTYSAV